MFPSPTPIVIDVASMRREREQAIAAAGSNRALPLRLCRRRRQIRSFLSLSLSLSLIVVSFRKEKPRFRAVMRPADLDISLIGKGYTSVHSIACVLRLPLDFLLISVSVSSFGLRARGELFSLSRQWYLVRAHIIRRPDKSKVIRGIGFRGASASYAAAFHICFTFLYYFIFSFLFLFLFGSFL